MAVKNNPSQFNYGYPSGAAEGAPKPIITNRNPTTADAGKPGQLWVNTVAASGFLHAGVIGGANQWAVNPLGAASVAALTVTPGNLVVDTGTLTVAGTSTLTGAVAMAAAATVGTTLTVGTDLAVGGASIFTGDVTINGDAVYNGDFDITSTDSISFTTSANAADAIVLRTNGGAAEVMTLQVAQGTLANSVDIQSVAGGVTISGALGTADAINLEALTAGGGIDIDASTGGVNVAAANGPVVVTSGTGAINISADATTTTVNLATGAGPKTLGLGSDNGASSTTVQTGTGAMTLTAGGILDANVVGAVTVDTAAGISLDGATASNFTVTGAADLTLASTLGAVVINAEEVANDAIQLTSAAGGLTANVGLVCDIDAAGAVTVDSSAAGVSIDGVTASNFTVTGAADLTLASTAGSVVVNAEEAVADAIQLTSAAGGLTATLGLGCDLNVTGAATLDATSFSIDSTTDSNITVTGAGQDLTLSSVGGSITVVSSEASATSIDLWAADPNSGVTITTGNLGISLDATAGVVDINSTTGLVTMTPGTDTQAGAAVTINANVGVGIFTGLTTAAGVEQLLTVTNSLCTVNSSIIATLSDLGTGDSQMFIRRVKPAAGSFTVNVINGGAAALDANLKLTFWLIQA